MTTQQSTAMQTETFKSFAAKILSGTATAIIVSLLPNAILANLIKYLPAVEWLTDLNRILVIFQYFLPIMAGFLIAENFKLTSMQQVAVGGAAYIGSGAWTWRFFDTVQESGKALEAVGLFQLRGLGDIINMMITATLAVLLAKWIGDRLGSLTIVLLPIIVGIGVGYLGWLMLPYVSQVTTLIGQAINSFTVLQPVLMSVLIAMSFAVLIVTPISTVGIGVAIGLTGLSAGAAAIGVAATSTYLALATARKNKAGVPAAILLGATKMMMPNVAANPIMLLPILVTAAVSALSVPLFNVIGTPATAGFGFIGLIGPLASLETTGIAMMIIIWFVIPFAVAYLCHYLCLNVFKLYSDDIFIFEK
ncbi:PTS sugar transporter subunit IIC [Streptococcus entericus]|uniref:PTS sugar transporter subunit IIC n=1 Tax=Streptococcus entericus TaxID=155680 RepID=UPI0003817E5C|nr:PTS sugar transporter subunit IIC [Streptococcus entericus]